MRRKTAIFGVVFAALVVLVAWIWVRGAEARAVRHLPADERRALYERTLSTLERPCSLENRPRGLDSFCREQAEFILQFPECDARCKAEVQQYLVPRAK